MVQVKIRVLAQTEQDARRALETLQPANGAALTWRPAHAGRRREWLAYGILELPASPALHTPERESR